jgi:hypothetical protein
MYLKQFVVDIAFQLGEMYNQMVEMEMEMESKPEVK